MKKFIYLFLTIVMALSLFTVNVFADEVGKAIEILEAAKKTDFAYNDMSLDSFVNFVQKLIPESMNITVQPSPMGNNFRCKNATPYKTGSVSADLEFSYNGAYPYKRTDDVSFKIPKLEREIVQRFSDVTLDAYYSEAVDWAVVENITTGTSETTFSPDATCTRAQIITFIYRAYGSSPISKTYKTSFKDISKDDYFYNAACWAEANGILTGSKFEGDKACTRSDVVTYLWKKAKSPEQSTKTQFTDVSSSAKYAQAVNWAVKEGITSGTSDTTFSPKSTCTRGQIATMLFRAFVK